MKNVIISFLTLLVIGCAHIVIEERFVPSKVDEKQSNIEKIYNPQQISHFIRYDNFMLYADLSLYQTDQSGLQFLGIDVTKEPNAKFQDGGELLALRLGIKIDKAKSNFLFSPGKVSLEVTSEQKDLLLLPIVSYQTKSEAVCSFDYNGYEWGSKSSEISAKAIINLQDNNDGQYQCFNILYKLKTKSIQEVKLNLTDSGIDNSYLFFHKKKVKWLRSN